ncbi:SGNH/GDSL hydrolase family protein [uncultured Draconibacterium sp.]|uniref:SGNH/GDSL hydrolase family protein n=1 Tax=uncultured Draconibacterium sp. TaxID=1573823 RepID=UPI0029C6F406|nr:SGNH/GDSL hydrolase family protein [uncultured Draconibacterium sp.]
MKTTAVFGILFLWCTCLLIAQEQTISLGDKANSELLYFRVKPEIVSVKTSLLFVINEEHTIENFETTTRFFTDKGIAVFKLNISDCSNSAEVIEKALLYILENHSELTIEPNKIGLFAYKGQQLFDALPDISTSFTISVHQDFNNTPGKKINFSDQIPVLLMTSVEQQKKNDNLSSFFESLSGRGNATSLLFTDEADTLSESQLNLVYNWIAGYGGLEPLFKEKTEAQKKAEDWVKYQEYLEHLLHTDWALRQRFVEENKKLKQEATDPARIVFMGNSITEGWINTDRAFFDENPYVNRGIGGQTTSQMLVRFRNDVVELQPKAVVILAGTNDIAGNTGPISLEDILGNIVSMAELAKSNGIQVYICSVLPASDYPWKPGLEPAPKIVELNKMLKAYTETNNCVYVDYFSAMVDERLGLQAEYSEDGVHPNLSGYKVMEPILQKALSKP